jgi:3-oxoacyl-[acyl-carrier-protein] synthase I
MSKIAYIAAHSILSPLGLGTITNWNQILDANSGISLTNKADITLKDFYASSFSDAQMNIWNKAFSVESNYSKLEKLMLTTLIDVQQKFPIDFSSAKTVFIFSTTKGNIDLLGTNPKDERISLPRMAKRIITFFGNPNQPYVVSNACISGVSAILLAKSLLKHRNAEQVVVCGADIISEFTVSGFNCLNAISPVPCKPFDQERMGLTPGEACGVLVLTNELKGNNIKISGGASSNDANHISGPSRTGDGLAIAIQKALKSANLQSTEIDFISTHGTATLFNDESESKALALTNLNLVEANSLKGYFGHTFGAAGIIETILTAKSMENSQIIASIGYEKHGVSTPMNIVTQLKSKNLQHSLKTASGFGSCNAALILSAE